MPREVEADVWGGGRENGEKRLEVQRTTRTNPEITNATPDSFEWREGREDRKNREFM